MTPIPLITPIARDGPTMLARIQADVAAKQECPGTIDPQITADFLASLGAPIVANNAARDAMFANPQGGERVFNLASGNPERYDPTLLRWLSWTGQRPGGIQALLAALDEATESVSALLIGDSTGNDVNEWFYLAGQGIAAKYSNWTVKHRLYDDVGNQFAGEPAVIQTGTAGARYALLTGSQGAGATATTALTIPYADVPFISGDIDVRVKVDPTTWTPAAIGVLASLFGAAGKRSWRFYLNTNGGLVWQYSTDGTTLVTANSVVVPGVSPGTPVWLRVVHDMTNVATTGTDISFYKSADGTNGTNWTLLNTVTNAGALASGLFNPTDGTTTWEIGGRQATVDLLNGKLYEVDIRNGISGDTVAPRLPDNWNINPTTVPPTFVGAPILTLVNASIPGAGIAYLSDPTRLTRMTQPYGQVVCFLSTSHNDNPISLGPAIFTAWDSWLAALKTKLPSVHFVLVTQNPQTTVSVNWRMHVVRRRMLMSWAPRNSVGVLDPYRAFLIDGRSLSLLVDPADGIHTLLPGSIIWATVTLSAMFF